MTVGGLLEARACTPRWWSERELREEGRARCQFLGQATNASELERRGSGQRVPRPESEAHSSVSLTCVLRLSGGRRTRRARTGRQRSSWSGRLHLFALLCLRGASSDDWRALYVVWLVRHPRSVEKRAEAERGGKGKKGEMSTWEQGGGRS